VESHNKSLCTASAILMPRER